MKFHLHIELGNATMQDPAARSEFTKAISDAAQHLGHAYALDGKITDDNGNVVGSWEVKPDFEWNPVVKQLKPSKSKPSKRSHTP